MAKVGIDLSNAIVLSKSLKVVDEYALNALKCNECNNLLRDAHQLLECGDRFCKQCLDNKLANESDPLCPVDNTRILVEEIIPDKACQKEISRLSAKCTGCDQWTGPLLAIEEHHELCVFIEVACEMGCGKRMLRNELEHHYAVCPVRKVLCQYCKKQIQFNKLQDHLADVCDSVMVVCEYCGKELIKNKLKEHHQLFCVEVEVKCSFSDCVYKGKLVHMKEHYKTHMVDLMKLIKECEAVIKHVHVCGKKKQSNLNMLEETILEYHQKIGAIKKKADVISDLSDNIKKLKKDVSQVSKVDVAQFDSGGKSPLEDSSELRTLGSQIVKLEQEILIIRPSIEEVQQVSNGFKNQMVGCVDTVQNIRETVSRHAVAMDEVKLRQDILDVKTVNGVFIWKIPEVGRRFREAQERRTLSLYSPPFHTSPHGYRMCIRAYLNGDGSGKGAFVSVFFVLMKSEHDNLLSWPFRRPVTFEMINQINRSKSISETFMPDDVSPSFQQPQVEMNVASGFPKFAKQSVLKDPQFTKDDSIFIRCKIDISGMQCD